MAGTARRAVRFRASRTQVARDSVVSARRPYQEPASSEIAAAEGGVPVRCSQVHGPNGFQEKLEAVHEPAFALVRMSSSSYSMGWISTTTRTRTITGRLHSSFNVPMRAKMEWRLLMNQMNISIDRAATVTETSGLRYLEPARLQFHRRGPLVHLTVEAQTTYLSVSILRVFPLSAPHHYLSVRDINGDEIGVFVNPDALDAGSQAIVRAE